MTPATLSQGVPSAPAQPELVAHVPASDDVYVVSDYTCARPLCLVLDRTTVAATHVTRVTLPPIRPTAGSFVGDLTTLAFATPLVGFALLGSGATARLYATYDGARSWHRRVVTVPGIIESVATTTTTLYLEVANCAVTVPYCQNFRVARSPLGADHWTSVHVPVSPTSAAGSFFGPVAALGAHVWVTETGSRAFVAHSKDGGRTFALVAAPELLSVAGCALSVTSATSLWAQCPTGMEEAFWYSGDAARSWTYVASPISGTAGGIFDPVSPNLAFLARGGTSGALERVTHAARSTITVGRLACSDVIGLAFVDAVHGLAACRQYTVSYLEVTINGGAAWRRVAIAP